MGKEPEVLVEECMLVNKDEVHAENKEAYENGIGTEPEALTHVEPQELLDVNKENGHDGIILEGNSEQQHKAADPVEVVNHESKENHVTQAIGKTEELQSSYNGEAQEPSGPPSLN